MIRKHSSLFVVLLVSALIEGQTEASRLRDGSIPELHVTGDIEKEVFKLKRELGGYRGKGKGKGKGKGSYDSYSGGHGKEGSKSKGDENDESKGKGGKGKGRSKPKSRDKTTYYDLIKFEVSTICDDEIDTPDGQKRLESALLKYSRNQEKCGGSDGNANDNDSAVVKFKDVTLIGFTDALICLNKSRRDRRLQGKIQQSQGIAVREGNCRKCRPSGDKRFLLRDKKDSIKERRLKSSKGSSKSKGGGCNNEDSKRKSKSKGDGDCDDDDNKCKDAVDIFQDLGFEDVKEFRIASIEEIDCSTSGKECKLGNDGFAVCCDINSDCACTGQIPDK